MGAPKITPNQPHVSLATTTVEVVYVKHGIDIKFPPGTRILIDVKTGLALFDNEDHTELDPDEYTFRDSN